MQVSRFFLNLATDKLVKIQAKSLDQPVKEV